MATPLWKPKKYVCPKCGKPMDVFYQEVYGRVLFRFVYDPRERNGYREYVDELDVEEQSHTCGECGEEIEWEEVRVEK
mgnify:CR=1 FL=1